MFSLDDVDVERTQSYRTGLNCDRTDHRGSRYSVRYGYSHRLYDGIDTERSRPRFQIGLSRHLKNKDFAAGTAAPTAFLALARAGDR